MEYIVLPTKQDFFEYSGDRIDGLLETDYRNQDDAIEVLFKRCYREITMWLRGIKINDLTDDDLDNWHILIMEQAVYVLSLGDKTLTGKGRGLSPNIPSLANAFGLWNRSVARC